MKKEKGKEHKTSFTFLFSFTVLQYPSREQLFLKFATPQDTIISQVTVVWQQCFPSLPELAHIKLDISSLCLQLLLWPPNASFYFFFFYYYYSQSLNLFVWLASFHMSCIGLMNMDQVISSGVRIYKAYVYINELSVQCGWWCTLKGTKVEHEY